VRRITIGWPAQALLGVTDGLAGVGANDPVGVTRIKTLGIEQVLQLHALAAAQGRVVLGPAASDEAPAGEAIAQEADGQRGRKQAEITVRVKLARGDATATVWTCDLSHDYVSINADYRS